MIICDKPNTQSTLQLLYLGSPGRLRSLLSAESSEAVGKSGNSCDVSAEDYGVHFGTLWS